MDGYLCGSVREITCLPSEESLHRLRNAGRASLQTADFVSLYMRRHMHFTYIGVFKSLSGLAPAEQFKQRQVLTSSAA